MNEGKMELSTKSLHRRESEESLSYNSQLDSENQNVLDYSFTPEFLVFFLIPQKGKK